MSYRNYLTIHYDYPTEEEAIDFTRSMKFYAKKLEELSERTRRCELKLNYRYDIKGFRKYLDTMYKNLSSFSNRLHTVELSMAASETSEENNNAHLSRHYHS